MIYYVYELLLDLLEFIFIIMYVIYMYKYIFWYGYLNNRVYFEKLWDNYYINE